MDIILQNYKNLIDNIIKDIFLTNVYTILKGLNGVNNVNIYIPLISSFDEALCS